jgi:hypothetical protein
MDKYYMFIRRFVNASFRLLMRYDWDSSSFQTYNDILTTKGGPLWYSVHRLYYALSLPDSDADSPVLMTTEYP